MRWWGKWHWIKKFARPTKPLITGTKYMLGDLTVSFSFNGQDVFGNPETITGARLWRDNVELQGTLVMHDALNGDFVVLDLDLPAGTVGGFELALVDDEGTTGLRSGFDVQVADEGPSAPMIGSVVFVPKQVPPSP